MSSSGRAEKAKTTPLSYRAQKDLPDPNLPGDCNFLGWPPKGF
jgi:hypothetical protein